MSNSRRIKKPNVHQQRVALAQAYFAQYPTAEAFTRDATPAERRVFDLPPGTVCRVIKMNAWSYAHAYAPPQAALN